MTGNSDDNSMGTGIGQYLGRIEDATPIARIHHDSSYVAQLIAAAAGLPQMHRRRRMERREAFVAYATADAVTLPRHDRIKRSA